MQQAVAGHRLEVDSGTLVTHSLRTYGSRRRGHSGREQPSKAIANHDDSAGDSCIVPHVFGNLARRQAPGTALPPVPAVPERRENRLVALSFKSMRKVLLFGAGKIGRMIATLLSESGDYELLVADVEATRLKRVADRPRVATAVVDARDARAVAEALAGKDAVVSALSYHHNVVLAEAARDRGLSYFDLTEDVATAERIAAIAAAARPQQVFVPQCGLAPGFVAICANHLTAAFDRVDSVHMRVGALPQFPSNALRYNLTWSTDGLINEYCNPCTVIRDGQPMKVPPLEGLEHFWLDGVQYEAFNTSGGVGTLCDTLAGRVRDLNYKTIRYPGHRDLMAFLVNDLRLSERREVLKDVLENAIPATFQDLVVVFCTASGWRKNQLVQISDTRTIYSQELSGEAWSAIQISTAAGLCAAVDLKFEGKLPDAGLVRQEQIALTDFLSNRFGRHYAVPPRRGETRVA
jgi:saccharopine dehydrogenase-like NADP-dependent oxidoreductase